MNAPDAAQPPDAPQAADATAAPDAPRPTAGRWVSVCAPDEIPRLGARVVRSRLGDIAIFRNEADEIFALRDLCPHKQGPLSQGIVHGRTVSCPLHAWKIDLVCGDAIAPDQGCTPHFPVEIRDGTVFLFLTVETHA